jgi:hypothetical protein
MTEEEFRALLKIHGKYELVINEKVIYEAFLVSTETGGTSLSNWASSENKEIVLDTLVEKFFGDSSANTK